jgi:PAS domain S-box-containing protein
VLDGLVVVLNCRGRIRWFNRACERATGYRAAEVLGRFVWDVLIPPGEVEEVKAVFSTVVQGIPGRHENHWLTRDGGSRMIQWTNCVVRDARGGCRYVVGTGVDVTDQRRGEEARESLQDSEARMRGIVETAAEAIVTIEETGAIESVNPAAGRMFGYTPRELIGRNVSVLMAEPERGEHDSYLRRYFQTGVGRVIGVGREVLCLRKDGSAFPCDLSVGEVRLRDRRLFTGVLRDATDRKRAEELRVAKEAADAANRAKDEVLAAVAHDLRTPLGAIGLWARLLKSPAAPDPERLEAVEAIEEAVRLQHRLIEDLLDASRVANGTLKFDARRVDLAALAREAVRTIGGAAGAGGVELNVEGCDATIAILGDPVRLQQALWNLLSNAVKFTPPGGRVRLALRRGEGTAEVCVSDTGCGIDVDSLPHVFDRYWQGRRGGAGLGLGLAIVRHIIELHGGTVRAESAGPGKGATFAFTLPLAAT